MQKELETGIDSMVDLSKDKRTDWTQQLGTYEKASGEDGRRESRRKMVLKISRNTARTWRATKESAVTTYLLSSDFAYLTKC